MRKILILTTILSGCLGLPFACIDGSRNNYYSEFHINSLSLKAGKITLQDQFYYNFQEVDFTSLNDTLPASNFGLSVAISDYSYVSASKPSPNWPGISGALADPAPSSADTRVTLISIYSDATVYANGAVFEEGDNLSPLFKASYANSVPESILQFIDEFYEWYEWEAILLHFDATLDEPLNQLLRVKFTMDDGSVFEMETSDIVVK